MLLRKAHSPGCRGGLKSVDVQGRCRESTIYAEKWNFSGEIVLCVIVTRDNSDNIYLTSSTTFGKQEKQFVEWYKLVAQVSTFALNIQGRALCKIMRLQRGHVKCTFKKYLATFKIYSFIPSNLNISNEQSFVK